MSNGSLRYWISWNEPNDGVYGADPRPTTWPLPASIPRWWCSGIGDGYLTICAIVDVNAEEESAKALIAKHWRPSEWRFCEMKGWTKDSWMPEASRFPPRSVPA